eukprot:TRINITY_DN26532_c0_g1_i2.p1 TRINITY_DN26532_c0_g1~~TRINITY_DN26532_c0_g1_i2.p1  ORF type:complete len:542 (+),score=112.68 TRINITY_DN26532_c0_g1_i2:56-1681(+)
MAVELLLLLATATEVALSQRKGHLMDSKEAALMRGDSQLSDTELVHLSGERKLVDDLIDPKTGLRVPVHQWWQKGGAGGRVPDQVRLSFGRNVSTGMVVSWSTYMPPTRPYVVYAPLAQVGSGALGGPESVRVFAHVTNLTRLAVNIEQYVMRAELDGLAADTAYAYQVGDWWPRQPFEERGSLSDVHHFRTLPEGQRWSPRLLMFGDMAVDTAVSASRMSAMVKDGGIDAVFHAGDIAYSLVKYSGTVGDRWMRTMAPFAAEVPYMVTAGDHDLRWGRDTWDMQQRFAMPGWRSSAGHPGAVLGRWGGLWWAVDIGPIHVVSYNTEMWHTHHHLGIVRDQYLWLREDLRRANENRDAVPWIVCIAHTPMYTSGARKRKVRGGKAWSAGWDPLSAKHRLGPPRHPGWKRVARNGTVVELKNPFHFERLLLEQRVDLSVQAHWHNYERFFPVYDSKIVPGKHDDPYQDPQAPIHLNVGNAGRGHEPFDKRPHRFSARRMGQRGFGVLKAVSDAELLWEAYECAFDRCCPAPPVCLPVAARVS